MKLSETQKRVLGWIGKSRRTEQGGGAAVKVIRSKKLRRGA